MRPQINSTSSSELNPSLIQPCSPSVEQLSQTSISPSEKYPLPPEWRKAHDKQHNNKPYFINKSTKETTWIDPRDAYWKKKAWAECGADEVPYGWEIDHDPLVGRYFIDHLLKINILDDPRSTQVQEQNQVMATHLDEAQHLLKEKRQTLTLKQEEIQHLLSHAHNQDQLHQAQSECTQIQQEATTLESNIQTLQSTLSRLKEEDQTGGDQLERYQRMQLEIQDLKGQISTEIQVRDQLHRTLEAMQRSYETGDHRQLLEVAEKGMSEKTAPIPVPNVASVVNVSQRPMTRLEREMEVLTLRQRLEWEQQETARLREIAEVAKREVERAMKMPHEKGTKKPVWIQLLNQYANKSATIRRNARAKSNLAVQEGGVMGFRDKLLFFTSGQ